MRERVRVIPALSLPEEPIERRLLKWLTATANVANRLGIDGKIVTEVSAVVLCGDVDIVLTVERS